MATGLPLRVLVIDDDPVMRELLEVVLPTEGYSVLAASSGEAALAMLAESGPAVDVVLSDLHLPGVCGSELAARMGEVCAPSTLLVGMSGSRPTQAERHIFETFLQKPFTTGELAEAIAKARAKHRGLTSSSTDISAAEAPAQDEAPVGPLAPGTATGTVLNEGIYARLAETLPAAQLRELYDLTLRDVRERLVRMQASEAAGDQDAVRREAHAIKGGTGMVGATELHLLASATEGGSAGSTPPLADFAAACTRLQRMLDARLHALTQAS